MPDNGVKAVPHLKHRCACKPDERSAIRQIRTKWRGEVCRPDERNLIRRYHKITSSTPVCYQYWLTRRCC
ncbi:hypothetical protein FGS43_21190 [Salmonella enterica]|uniref:Uncharacterized protein n=6 Tax=Salmonella enterica TaxID=28901 RepID=A0A5Y3L0I6_SALET|nr:hypothetical protein SEEM0315_006470 [Salmonella enterica subsp. enterica serovar Muenster str. 0315]APY64598.1 hypothetical protein LFZ19_13980 [Salmonella enterica subsp. enterica serovar Johannesburg str. ST203]AUM48879.1 hypothetical protein SEEM0420_006260 [Salmonella enterica subsp. enterica serovar Muenster str. 420]EAA3002534.1 hypothetical protein [Salmonella enterica subsp. enterica serovar Muenster]EAA6863227.1 hypothetical protein [Salmonella enterica subsp. enterica serovar Joha